VSINASNTIDVDTDIAIDNISTDNISSNIAVSTTIPSFSAHVDVQYDLGREIKSFTVQFLHNNQPVYVHDPELLGAAGSEQEPVFRFFDWENPLWKQITGTIIKEQQIQYGQCWYTHKFTFLVEDDILGIDYFGLRFKKGMFGSPHQQEDLQVLCACTAQHMTFDTTYFILNPKDPLRNLIQIRQDEWMPLLVSSYILGSAVERRGRPYFSRAIERICEWFECLISQRCMTSEASSNKTIEHKLAERQLIAQMLHELWDKGPRRLIAFYSGMGYVFKALGLENLAADVIYDEYTNLQINQDPSSFEYTNYISPRLFASMLLLGLRTEKARLYVAIDLNDHSRQESHTQHGIRELLDSRVVMDLFFAPHSRQYAPIAIPKAFDLHWGQLKYQPGYPQVAYLDVSFKRDSKLQLTISSYTEEQRCLISLSQQYETGREEWLGRLVLSANPDTNQVCFVSESMTSNFRYLRDINAFKYILLIAAVHYALYVLHVSPQQMTFEADFFDHCAPYDLLLLKQCGWEPMSFDMNEYNLNAAKVVLYSGRAMTLPLVRIPAHQPYKSSLLAYLLGKNSTTVAIDQDIYQDFIIQLQQSGGEIFLHNRNKILIDGISHHLVDIQRFHSAFTEYLSPFGMATNCA